MNCRTHQQTEAVARCAGCAESFCKNCVIELAGQHYCASCKTLALGGRTPVVGMHFVVAPEAGEALRLALISIPCCGVIFGPMAMSKASEVKRRIAADPMLLGYGKANAAFWIGLLGTLWFVLNMIVRVASSGSSRF